MVRIPTPLLLSGALLFSSPLWASDLKVEVLQDKLDHPWSVAFLPDNQTLLITERSGQLRSWRPDSGLSEPIQGVPKVWAQRQSGLLDVVLAPDFAQSRRVWLSYTEADSNGKAGAVVGYGKLSPDNRQLTDFHEVIQQTPRLSSGNNIGTRLAFDRQGFLWIAFGDNFVSSAAQDLDKLQGKLLRLNADGSVPNDNPFVNKPGARPEIWAYGLRNPQGLALNPWTQVMWESEHGPRGGDEVNIIQKGKNYAGRWQPTALITTAVRCRNPKARMWQARNSRRFTGKSRQRSAVWRFITAHVFHSGKIRCLLAR